jgi:hypothetical protein
MQISINDQVIDFYQSLFKRIFFEPFNGQITERLKRNTVSRQVEETADAASQSLNRFFNNERLTKEQTASILSSFEILKEAIKLENVSNPRVTPESIIEAQLKGLSCPASLCHDRYEAIFGIALNSVVQVLMLVGPVMAEWKKLNFSSTFEPPRRVTSRLNQFTEQLEALKSSGPSAKDEEYELTYRDHLLQRFFRIEAGTVQMTTNLAVDLRDLFVMPRVLERPKPKKIDAGMPIDDETMMDLAAARRIFFDKDDAGVQVKQKAEDNKDLSTVEQIKNNKRTTIIGTPGGGKSTLLEWLQLQIAEGKEEFVAGNQQAIPLLLRIRQLDPHNLPQGRALIEKATASSNLAQVMPAGWIERYMKAGHVLVMVDGLDETEPELRDEQIISWLAKMVRDYPDCYYLISSRPVGYPPGSLRKLKFAECDLLDFGTIEITEYTRHWCTAIRLKNNEPEDEARSEGIQEGDEIVSGFKDHPYIRNLARNPLMLSAICLVNYFEGGELPKDRARLYKLCVEGLLHNWDKRRGIRTDFSLTEKLRVCREVAIAMQTDNLAEYPAEQILEIFVSILQDEKRALRLLENIRYRTGLLIERRPKVFAFAHLTFQEYLEPVMNFRI